MSSLFLSILSIYLFILVGYSAKKIFTEKIDEKSLNLLSVYFLQIFLTFWGLLKRPIDTELVLAPLAYAGIIILILGFVFLLAKQLFDNAKERSIASIAALIGNTGNLGVPLGIAIFGEESVPFTTLINLINVFIVYTLGVYFYSRGNFSIKESIKNIFKLPLLWFAILAIFLNLSNVSLPHEMMNALEMGAYTSMVIQLIILGMYLYSVKLKHLNIRLTLHTQLIKFIILPAVTLIILHFSGFSEMVKGVILLEILMPLAVSNVNLASLYGCNPSDVTAQIFISSMLFLVSSYFILYLFKLL